MTQASKARLTKDEHEGEAVIQPEAFLRLYDEYPGMMGEVFLDLAEHANLESLRSAVASGILDKPEAPNWSYAVLPLVDTWDFDEAAIAFAKEWLAATGGDQQERLDKRLVGEMNPGLVNVLLEMGARIGPVDSNGENALKYALSQSNSQVIYGLVQHCNTNGTVPMCGEESILAYLAALNEAYGRSFVKNVLPEREDICDAIRLDAGRVASGQGTTRKPKPSVRLSLMTIAKMDAPQLWSDAIELGEFLKTKDSEFFADGKSQAMVVENMLADGLSLNHRFPSAVSIKYANGNSSRESATLLQAAAQLGDIDTVIRLLEMGADPEYKSLGKTARDYADAQTKSAFDTYAAKKNIDRVLIGSKIQAILYAPAPSAKKTARPK